MKRNTILNIVIDIGMACMLSYSGKVFASGHKIYYPVLPGPCDTGEKCHAGELQYRPDRHVSHDTSTAYGAAVAGDPGTLSWHKISDYPF